MIHAKLQGLQFF